jgi:hypothetical protein
LRSLHNVEQRKQKERTTTRSVEKGDKGFVLRDSKTAATRPPDSRQQ